MPSGFKDFRSPLDYAVLLVFGEGGKGECIPDEGIGEVVVLFKVSHKVLPCYKHEAFDDGEGKIIRVFLQACINN